MTYNSTLPKVFVYLLTTIETLYQTSVPLEVQNRKNVHLATSDCLVIACYLWGVLHFSETLKAKHQLAQSLFPNFLEYSAFAQFERELILERTQEGKRFAKAHDPNFREGRPKKYTKEQLQLAYELKQQGLTYKMIERKTGISISTQQRAFKQMMK